MTARDPIAEIERTRLLVIVRLAKPGDHVPAALEAAGVTALEVSLLSGAALATIERWRQRHPTLAIGAGTVLSGEDAAAAIEAGAQFIVSPGMHDPVAAHAARAAVDYIPGAMTPSECYHCACSGARLIKLFPAATLGPSYLRDLRGPFPDLRLMPTGSVGKDNAAAFLRAGASAVAVGSSLVSDRTTEETIRREARSLLELIGSNQQGDS
jgi:2-dehydro-3-deoxyphosphogluconate aldolase/(4S)-4-hydroxy-2-oxoglutarate aldolase